MTDKRKNISVHFPQIEKATTGINPMMAMEG
jgi:hypothetical protein